MKRFEFRLEKLLNLREFYEHQAEIELAHAIAHKDYIDIELKQIAKLKIKTGAEFNPDLEKVDITDLHNAQNYTILLDKKKDELLEKLVIAEQIIEEKRKIYIIKDFYEDNRNFKTKRKKTGNMEKGKYQGGRKLY